MVYSRCCRFSGSTSFSKFSVTIGVDSCCPAFKFILWGNIADAGMQTFGVVMVHVGCHQSLGIV